MEQPNAKRSLDITNAEHIGLKHGVVEITVLGRDQTGRAGQNEDDTENPGGAPEPAAQP